MPLYIMETQTPAIVALSNTHQVVSLKLMNINYLYWWMQMKPHLLGQSVFHFVTAQWHVLCLMFLTVLLVLPLQSTLLFFVGSNRINLFWVCYSPLSPWMCCILWQIVIPCIVPDWPHGQPLDKPTNQPV
jgi:hypothetical protein